LGKIDDELPQAVGELAQLYIFYLKTNIALQPKHLPVWRVDRAKKTARIGIGSMVFHD
jgi:hypothetical protein